MAKGRGVSPNSLANLKPAKLGEVRNPTGRSRTYREMLDRLRFQTADALVDELTKLVSKKHLTRSDRIRLDVLKTVWEMVNGRPFQAVGVVNEGAMQGPDGAPVSILLLNAERERSQHQKTIEARANSRVAELMALVSLEERERITGVSIMLAEAQLSASGRAPTQWAITAHLLGEARATELLGPEVKPDFICPPDKAPWSAREPQANSTPNEPAPAPDAEPTRFRFDLGADLGSRLHREPEAAAKSKADLEAEAAAAIDAPHEPPTRGSLSGPPRAPKGAPADFARHYVAKKEAEFLSEQQTKARDAKLVELQEQARARGEPGGLIPQNELNALFREEPRYQEVIVGERIAGSHEIRHVAKKVKV